ncbi:MAG TPA: MCE family protein [Thiotrichales bacterium]|nr:MCE family protein [Thiotrichales bacterium]
MSERGNPTLVGGFVVGAAALLVLLVLLLSDGNLFQKQLRFVLFFQGSVFGLQPGAPVSFRGVRVGNVQEVELTVDLERGDIYIPVYITIDTDRFRGTRGERGEEVLIPFDLESLIRRGLRAQLQLQSLVTGQYFINLDFMPDEPVRLVGGGEIVEGLEEIPTVATSMEQIEEVLDPDRIREMLADLARGLERFAILMESDDLHGSLAALRGTLEETESLAEESRRLVAHLDVAVERLEPRLYAMLEEGRGALAGVDRAFASLERVLEASHGTLAAIEEATESLQHTLRKTDRVMEGAAELVDAELEERIDAALRELERSARELRNLTLSVERLLPAGGGGQ